MGATAGSPAMTRMREAEVRFDRKTLPSLQAAASVESFGSQRSKTAVVEPVIPWKERICSAEPTSHILTVRSAADVISWPPVVKIKCWAVQFVFGRERRGVSV